MWADWFEPNKNVLVAFTGDEEEESRGAYEVMQWLEEKEIKTNFVIVTDVTSAGYDEGKGFTIENVFPEGKCQKGIVKYLKKAVKPIDDHPMVVMADDDDGAPGEAWDYDEKGFACCSVCFPCRGDMHSEEGVTVNSAMIGNYALALLLIARATLSDEFNALLRK